MAAIEDAADLSASVKRHWVCSLRQIAKWLDRPVRSDPGALDGDPLAGRSAAPRPPRRHRKDRGQPQIQRRGGAALVRQGAQRALTRGGACRRSGLYCGMVSAIAAVAARLYGLMRYCSGLGLRPDFRR